MVGLSFLLVPQPVGSLAKVVVREMKNGYSTAKMKAED